MNALDYMIDNALWDYRCDSWQYEPGPSNYRSVDGMSGQVEHRGEVFVVQRVHGRDGLGGMDEGYPPSVHIMRIRLPRAEAPL